MSALGIIVAMLSLTGVVIWVRKRRARVLRPERTILREQFNADAV